MGRKEIICELARRVNELRLRDKVPKGKDELQYASYWDATVYELLRRLRESDNPPMLIIEDFIKQMSYGNGIIFSTSYDAAMWMLDELLTIL